MTSSSRVFVLALLGSALVLPPAFSGDSAGQQSTLSPPLGCWKINANGNLGTLCIPALNADNTFAGTMTINGEVTNPIAGFWSSGPQQVTFLRLPPAGSGMNPFTFQSFVAVLFPMDVTNPTGQQMLAGSFNAYGPSGGAGSASNSFAWTATHP
jgi:hypothetical protein